MTAPPGRTMRPAAVSSCRGAAAARSSPGTREAPAAEPAALSAVTNATAAANPLRRIMSGTGSDLDDDGQDHRTPPDALIDEGRDVVMKVLLKQRGLALLVTSRLREAVADDLAYLLRETVR